MFNEFLMLNSALNLKTYRENVEIFNQHIYMKPFIFRYKICDSIFHGTCQYKDRTLL